MPLYEYHCEKCNQLVELLVRNSLETPHCPQCGSPDLDKQLSIAAAPVSSNSELPVCGPSSAPTCGRPQCQSGCMFD